MTTTASKQRRFGSRWIRRRTKLHRVETVFVPVIVELLEDRTMLSGVTIITHGAQAEGSPNLRPWVREMSNVVADRIADFHGGKDEKVAQFRMELTRTTGNVEVGWFYHGDFQNPEVNPRTYDLKNSLGGEAIIALDWSAIAFPGERTTQTVAQAVAQFILSDLGDLGKQLLGSEIHLIGHSRGASLIGALAEDLGEAGIWVDQATYLDSHPITGDWRNDDIGATSNIVFADSYWRCCDGLNGEEVEGAANQRLQDNILEKGGYTGLSNEHKDVHIWYHGTIDKVGLISDGTINNFDPDSVGWYNGAHPGRTTSGYNFSRVEGVTRPNGGRSQDLDFGFGERDPIDYNASHWPSLIEFRRESSSVIEIGDPLEVSYYWHDWDGSALLALYIDTDRNPYNGTVEQIGQNKVLPTTFQKIIDNGSYSVSTTDVNAGQYNLLAKIFDLTRTRYVYAPGFVEFRDTTSPDNIGSFTATAGDRKVSLRWTNPSDADFVKVKIQRKTGSYPKIDTDGTTVYNDNDTSFTDTGLTNGTRYYYKAFSYDEVPNYSSGSSARVTPQNQDTIRPLANLSDPTNTGSIKQSTLNNRRYIDVTFADTGGSRLDRDTIFDTGQEFTLAGSAANGVTVNGAATLVSGTTYRYTFSGTFGTGLVIVNFTVGTWADVARNTNLAEMESFTIKVDDPPPGDLPLIETFDSYQSGIDFPPAGSPWELVHRDDNVSIKIDEIVSFNGGNSLRFLDDDSIGGSGIVRRTFSETTSISLEFYMRSANASFEGAFTGLKGDAGSDLYVSFGNTLGGGDAGYIGILNDDGWLDKQFLLYEVGKWYHVRRTWDAETNTGSVYVAEVDASGSDIPSKSKSLNNISSYAANNFMDAIEIFTSGGQGADAYIDSLIITDTSVTKPNTPSGLSPSDGATNVSLTPTLTSSSFSDPDSGDTHKVTQWQVATDSSFNNDKVVWDHATTLESHKTSEIVPLAKLSNSTRYYWRMRYQDNHDLWSDWSSSNRDFTTLAKAFNIPPTLAPIPDPAVIAEDSGLQTINLSGISAGGGEIQILVVTAVTSDNPSLIPNPMVDYISPNLTGSLSYIPEADKSGTAKIAVTVTDAGLDGIAGNADDTSFLQTFTIRVHPVNDWPTLNPIPTPAAIENDAGQQTINLKGITAGGGESQTLVVTASSNNESLIPNPAVSYTSANTTGTLSYTPVARQSGTAVIKVTVTDAGLDGIAGNSDDAYYWWKFTVRVIPEAPTFTGPKSPTSDITPTFTWEAVEGGETYELLVYNVPLGREVLHKLGLTGTSYEPEVVSSLAMHQAFLKATNVVGSSDWSPPLFFEVVGDTPTNLKPVDGSTVISNKPLFDWDDIEGAASYNLLAYNTNRGLEVTNQRGLTESEFQQKISLLPELHEFHVQAVYPDGESSYTKSSFTVKGAIIRKAPTNLMPSDGSTGNSKKPLFDWGDVKGATSYNLLAYNTNRGLEVTNQRGLTESEFQQKISLLPELHEFHVQAVYPDGESSYTKSSFVIGVRTPSFISPKEKLNDSTPTFIWTEADNADTYELLIYDFAAGREVRRYKEISTNLFTIPDIDSLTLNRRFQAFFRAHNSEGAGPWSSPLHFDLVASSDAGDVWKLVGECSTDQPVVEKTMEEVAVVSTDDQTMEETFAEQTAEDETTEELDVVMAGWSNEEWWHAAALKEEK